MMVFIKSYCRNNKTVGSHVEGLHLVGSNSCEQLFCVALVSMEALQNLSQRAQVLGKRQRQRRWHTFALVHVGMDER